MPVLVRITVPNPEDILDGYGTGALVRLESAALEAGPYTEIDTETVVAGTRSYEIWDVAGSNASWYRTRYSGTDTPTPSATFSTYSDPFTPAEPEAYATLDDLLVDTRSSSADTKFLARAEKALRDATTDLTREIGYSFFRQPRSGTETWTAHGTGDGRIHVHEGIVSLETVEIRQTTGGDWIELEADDWYLEGEPGDPYVRPGDPYFHIALTDVATYTHFPRVKGGVRFTGAKGWPAITNDQREATVAWARQKVAADPSLPGGQLGPDEHGSPWAPDRKPQVVYDLIRSESLRHIGCEM